MWIVAKYKSRELELFKKNLSIKIGDKIKFYLPKMKQQRIVNNCKKIFGKSILENYIICYHPKFSDQIIINQLNNIRGLIYFLQGHIYNQDDINKFINYCENFIDSEGYLTSKFFDNKNFSKGKFITGPFTNMIFEIIERQKNYIKILIGNKKATVSINDNLYSPA